MATTALQKIVKSPECRIQQKNFGENTLRSDMPGPAAIFSSPLPEFLRTRKNNLQITPTCQNLHFI
jgi:hypothetical protein